MTFYHCSHAWLAPGSVIRKGNYGRIVRKSGAQHPHWIREQFLEHIRVHEFPDRPSRLDSAFVCESRQVIRYFAETHCKTGIVYEVEPVEDGACRHTTDFNCVQPIVGALENMVDVARNYWAASYWYKIDGRPGLRCAETLIDSDLRVIGEIT